MIILDTSALIRFLVNDDHFKSDKVRNLLKSGRDLQIPDVVILEISFILLKKYLFTKQFVCEGIKNILAQTNIISSAEINKALNIYTKNSISLADCLIIAGLPGESQLASFDKKLIRIAKVKSIF